MSPWFGTDPCPQHRWRWSGTWHSIGFHQCECGATRSVGPRQVVVRAPDAESRVVDADKAFAQVVEDDTTIVMRHPVMDVVSTEAP